MGTAVGEPLKNGKLNVVGRAEGRPTNAFPPSQRARWDAVLGTRGGISRIARKARAVPGRCPTRRQRYLSARSVGLFPSGEGLAFRRGMERVTTKYGL